MPTPASRNKTMEQYECETCSKTVKGESFGLSYGCVSVALCEDCYEKEKQNVEDQREMDWMASYMIETGYWYKKDNKWWCKLDDGDIILPERTQAHIEEEIINKLIPSV